MVAEPPVRIENIYISSEDYLAEEETRETRHEYVAGMVRAMPGTNLIHSRIAGNLNRHLSVQLDAGECEAFQENVKVYIHTAGDLHYYYPDIVVDCSKGAGHLLMAPHPKVIFEVLSDSTEAVDRGEKLVSYCTLPSLQVYVLVWQTRPALLLYRRNHTEWKREFVGGLDQTLTLPEINCQLALRDIYKRVQFED